MHPRSDGCTKHLLKLCYLLSGIAAVHAPSHGPCFLAVPPVALAMPFVPSTKELQAGSVLTSWHHDI